MLRTLAFAALLLVAALPASAGLNEGVAALDRGDYGTAYLEFKPLAEQGDAIAQLNLGFMYEKGWGVPKNYREAAHWYRKAALQGDAMAQFNLGFMYEKGWGVPKNYREAFRWYRKAADTGHAKAQGNLGVMYASARGVPKDNVQAYMWMSLAAVAGNKIAAENLEILEKRMTPAQVAKAQKMAAKWRPNKATPAK